ncbi:MAG: hypothetical protein JNL98_17395 [Bryobacterales bacterium]|nr:hypothetical protein [Bryobacterales bacterium]
MLKLAADSGTTDIVGTPHADLEYHFQPDLIQQRLDELNTACNGTPRIYSGCDFHLTYDNIQDALANPAKYTINHRNYLLVEFSDMLIFQNTGDIFAHLRQQGIIPIITHPERNPLLQKRLDSLVRWVEEGALMQVTAQSYFGRFGKTARDFSLELMRLNLVHFVASDAHDTKHRPPMLDKTFEWVAEKYGEATARRLMIDNPKAAIDGTPLPPAPRLPETPPPKWFEFWRS